MAQFGSLFRSARRLVEGLDPQGLRELPGPPMPVQLEVDQDGAIIIALLVTLPAGNPGSHELALNNLADHGFHVTTWAGRVAAGYASLNDLDMLVAKAEDDLFIEAAHVVHSEVDVSVPEAWNLPVDWSGSTPGGGDVVIGIADLGIDPAHPSLRTTAGTTRIIRLWDQTVPGAAPPPAPYRNGSEWDNAAIDSYLAAASTPFPAKIAQHGTAVAGIAASNGLCAPAGRFTGVAPDADLVVVTLNASRRVFTSTANVIDAVRYIFGVADALGKRAVVNLSQGAQIGPHDPNGQFELGISALLAEDENRIVVTSMGNLGQADAHARLFVPPGGITELEIEVPSHVGPFVTLELWFDSADTLGVQVIDPAGNATSVVESDLGYAERLGSEHCDITVTPNVRDVRANEVLVMVTTESHLGDVSAGRWIVRLNGRDVRSGQPVHGWLERGKIASSSFASPHIDPDYTVTGPATADEVIPVSAYSMGPRLGRFAALSSRGPDRLGGQLAGLAAPGDPVTSCMASPFYPASAHVPGSGTSYAAAHVTGAIAVLLQAQPALNRKQVRDCLLRNARVDSDTSAGPMTGWGAGKLDIHAALRCATNNGVYRQTGDSPMGLRAELTVVPGPIDPHSGRPSLEAPYDGALQDFLATPGVAGTEVETALNRTLLQAAQETAEGTGRWDAVRQFFARKSHTVVAEGEQTVELEGYWMTLPDVPGASVTLTVSIDSSKETSASFTIAGLGGGPTFTVDLKEGLSHQSAVCERITVTTTGVFQKIQLIRNGTVIGTYPRLISLDIKNLAWKFAPAAVPSAASLGHPLSTTRFDATATAGTTAPTLEITHGTTWDVLAGIDLPNLGGIKAQMSMKTTYERDVKLEYSLPGGHLYVASRYRNLPVYLWAIS